MDDVMRTELVGQYGDNFTKAVDSVNQNLVKSDVKNFDILMLVNVLIGVYTLLKDCNFKLPGRLNFFQKRRLTRTISRVMIEPNDEDSENAVYDALLKQHKSMSQEDLDKLVEELNQKNKNLEIPVGNA